MLGTCASTHDGRRCGGRGGWELGTCAGKQDGRRCGGGGGWELGVLNHQPISSSAVPDAIPMQVCCTVPVAQTVAHVQQTCNGAVFDQVFTEYEACARS